MTLSRTPTEQEHLLGEFLDLTTQPTAKQGPESPMQMGIGVGYMLW